MGEERAQAGSLQKPSKRIRTARALGIVTAVFSVLGFLSLVFNTILVGTSIPELLADPAFLAEAEDSGIVSLVAAVGFSGLSSAEAVAAVFTLVALFPGFDALTCLVSLAASIGMVRSVKNPQLRRRCFGLGLVSGITSLLTLRFVTGTLLVVESVLVHMQHVEDEGGSQAYYADGKHIGFMRFVEFACIAEIIVNVTLLLFITKSESYDGAWWINFVMLLMMAVTLWIIWNRKSHGREIILAMVSVYLVINLVYYVSMGTFYPFTFMINAFWPIVMLGVLRFFQAGSLRPFASVQAGNARCATCGRRQAVEPEEPCVLAQPGAVLLHIQRCGPLDGMVRVLAYPLGRCSRHVRSEFRYLARHAEPLLRVRCGICGYRPDSVPG